MKVVQVIPNFGIGGTQKAGCVLAAGLAEAGNTAVVVGRGPGPRYLENPPEGVTHHLSEATDDTTYAQEIISLEPDVIHLHDGAYNEELIEALAKAGARVDGWPLLVQTPVFGRPPKDRATLGRVRTCLIGAYMLYRQRHWMSMSTAEAIRNGIGYVHINSFERTEPPQSTLDSPEVRAARRAELGVPNDAFVVGRIGRDTMEKWHPLHEPMIDRLLSKHENAAWLSIGMPVDRGRDRLKARWGDRFVNPPESPDFLVLAKTFAAMDVQAFFSCWGECFSTTICEAAGVGLPTIAGTNPLRDNGQSEQLIDGENGFLVSGIDQALGHIDHLISDPEACQRLKQQTFDYAHARWTTKQITQDLLAFYNAWTDPNPAAAPHLKWVAETEGKFAAGYRNRIVGLQSDGIASGLWWRMKLAAVANWNTFRLGVRFKNYIRG